MSAERDRKAQKVVLKLQDYIESKNDRNSNYSHGNSQNAWEELLKELREYEEM